MEKEETKKIIGPYQAYWIKHPSGKEEIGYTEKDIIKMFESLSNSIPVVVGEEEIEKLVKQYKEITGKNDAEIVAYIHGIQKGLSLYPTQTINENIKSQVWLELVNSKKHIDFLNWLFKYFSIIPFPTQIEKKDLKDITNEDINAIMKINGHKSGDTDYDMFSHNIKENLIHHFDNNYWTKEIIEYLQSKGYRLPEPPKDLKEGDKR